MNKVYLMNIFCIFGLFLFQLFLVVTGINSSLTKKKRKKLGIKNKMKTMYRFSCLWIFKVGKTFVFYKLLVIYIFEIWNRSNYHSERWISKTIRSSYLWRRFSRQFGEYRFYYCSRAG